MNLVASLPWYDLPTLHQPLNDFWSVLKEELCGRGFEVLPGELNRSMPLADQWAQPGLVISQCCGPDLFTPAAKNLKPIARPMFSDLDCTSGHYFSYLVAAKGLKQEPRCLVVNCPSSRSGCIALLEWAIAQGLRGKQVLVSGSHEESLNYLREGSADLAAIDAHSWSLLYTEGVSIIGRSAEAQAPPFVMHQDCSVAAEVVVEALAYSVERAGAAIGMQGIIPTGIEVYRSMREDVVSLDWYCSQHTGTIDKHLGDSLTAWSFASA